MNPILRYTLLTVSVFCLFQTAHAVSFPKGTFGYESISQAKEKAIEDEKAIAAIMYCSNG